MPTLHSSRVMLEGINHHVITMVIVIRIRDHHQTVIKADHLALVPLQAGTGGMMQLLPVVEVVQSMVSTAESAMAAGITAVEVEAEAVIVTIIASEVPIAPVGALVHAVKTSHYRRQVPSG